MNEEHILSDFESELDPANRNVRFVNFIVDRAVFFFVMKGINLFWATYLPMLVYSTDLTTANIITVLAGLLLYGFITGLTEVLLKGRTVGKLITGTRAVNPDGIYISAGTGFLRGLIRIIPFEPFSAFGGEWPRPWHDRWTNTWVVKERTSILPGR